MTFPVKTGKGKDETTVWHKLGAAWTRDAGSIGIVLDVGVPITLPPGAQLVLVQNEEEEAGSRG